MHRYALILALAAVPACLQAQSQVPQVPQVPSVPVDATLADGRTVTLHPDGRWEFKDRLLARQAQQVQDSQKKGNLGFGRYVPPGDPDYNRGSLNPRTR